MSGLPGPGVRVGNVPACGAAPNAAPPTPPPTPAPDPANVVAGEPPGVAPKVVCVTGLPGVQVGLTAIEVHTANGLCPHWKITGLGVQTCGCGLGGQMWGCGLGGQNCGSGLTVQWISRGLCCVQKIGCGLGGGGQKNGGLGGQKVWKGLGAGVNV
jgi:hypothetical protein